MKHLLNNLSEEEKNKIREQHTGGMKVDTKNFSKLLKSKLGNLRPITEQSEINILDGISEQSKISSSSSKEYNMIDTCASMGVKTPGYCDTQGKKPVKSCASLGVKTPGFCYVDSKKPIPNQAPKGTKFLKK